jgi:hypothetical protein
MMPNPGQKDVDQFIVDEIETVPHLEALLLLWNSRPREWPLEELSKSLYLPEVATRLIVADLEQRGLVAPGAANAFAYRSSERDTLIDTLEKTYRHQVVRISNMIHSKPAASLREFARAFRVKKG